MNLLSIINNQFENLYPEDEVQRVDVTEDDLKIIANIADITLPKMYKDVLEEGVIYTLGIKETSIIIGFCHPATIKNLDVNYPFFKEDVKKGIIFATDLGDLIYYYGEGKEGMGLYLVEAGVGDFFNEAIKFADSFDDFFIDGKGIDVLKKLNYFIIT